jgi:hypothetical protein
MTISQGGHHRQHFKDPWTQVADDRGEKWTLIYYGHVWQSKDHDQEKSISHFESLDDLL